MKKKIKNFTFAYSQGQGGWTIGFEQHDYCDIEIKYYLVFLYWNFKTGGGGFNRHIRSDIENDILKALWESQKVWVV